MCVTGPTEGIHNQFTQDIGRPSDLLGTALRRPRHHWERVCMTWMTVILRVMDVRYEWPALAENLEPCTDTSAKYFKPDDGCQAEVPLTKFLNDTNFFH